MVWLFEVLARRARAHSGALAAVTALTLVTSTLLGAFAALGTTAQDDALAAALDEAAPEDVALVADLGLDGFLSAPEDAGPAADTASRALAGLVPEAAGTTATVRPSTGVLQTAPDLSRPTTYLAAVPDRSLVEVVEGTVPAHDAPGTTSDGAATIPVAVPQIAAEDLGWRPGDRLTLRGTNDSTRVTVEVTGIYELTGAPSSWSGDMLGGAGHDPAHTLPESFGSVSVRIWGPLLAPASALLDGTVPAADARVTVAPDLSGLTLAQADALGERLSDGQAVLSSATDGTARSARLDTRLDDTLAGVEARLAATRTGVLVAGLVLASGGGAALLLASRLVSEQRVADGALMAARGLSRRQMLRLAGLEAAGVALVAALTGPWLAALLVVAVSDAVAPPGVAPPAVGDVLAGPALWWTCAAGAAALAALLVVPVLRSDDDAGTETRPGRAAAVRAAFARSGGTVALLAVAGVATWQLASYGTVPPDGVTDPVLVAAPTLLILACALLAARTLPLLARVTDVVAARSRRLVGPLAAWETGRRPGRAAGTVLLVAVTVAGGTFAQVTLTTWRTSQIDQADLAVGTEARLTDVAGSPLDAAARVTALSGRVDASLVPVTDRNVAFGRSGDDADRAARLLAVDDGALLRGRLVPVAGLDPEVTWTDVVADLDTSSAARGVPLPAGTARISARVRASTAPSFDGTATVEVVVEDAAGVRSQRRIAQVPLGEAGTGSVALRDDGPVDDAVRIVGFLVTAVPADGVRADPGMWENPAGAPEFRVAITDLVASDAAGSDTPVVLDGDWAARPRPDRGTGPDAEPAASAVAAPTAAGGIIVTQRIDPVVTVLEGAGTVAAPAAEDGVLPGTRDGEPLPAVVTADLAEPAEIVPGDTIRLGSPAPVELMVVGIVEHLPGAPGARILVDRTSLQTAELALAAPARGPDAWWGPVRDDDVPGLTTAAADQAPLRTMATERETLLAGPARVGFQTAMWLLTAATVLLAGAGVAGSVAAGLGLRRLELARLQALGVPRGTLVRSVLAEQGILAAVGLLGGAVAGAVAGALLAPALAVGPDGRPPVPDAVLDVSWTGLGLLAGAACVVVVSAAAITARARVRQASADLLRLGADR